MAVIHVQRHSWLSTAHLQTCYMFKYGISSDAQPRSELPKWNEFLWRLRSSRAWLKTRQRQWATRCRNSSLSAAAVTPRKSISSPDRTQDARQGLTEKSRRNSSKKKYGSMKPQNAKKTSALRCNDISQVIEYLDTLTFGWCGSKNNKTCMHAATNGDIRHWTAKRMMPFQQMSTRFQIGSSE